MGDFIFYIAFVLGGFGLLHAWLIGKGIKEGLGLKLWVLILIILVLSAYFIHKRGKEEKEAIEALLSAFGPTYAQELELMGHATITLATPGDDPTYLSMIQAQKRWLQANPRINDIYTMRKTMDGTKVFLVDSETDYDRDGRYEGPREARTPIGETFDQPDAGMDKAFDGKSNFNETPTRDRWGEWVSATFPLYDEHGKIEAILGIDYDAQQWMAAGRKGRRAAMGFFGLIFMILAGSSSVIAFLKYEIMARRRNEETQKRFTDILEVTPDLVAIADADEKVIYLNRAGRSLLGVTEKDMEVSLSRLFGAADPDAFPSHILPAALHKGLWKGESSLVTPDGTEIPMLSVLLSHRSEEGKVLYLSAILRDISEQKRIEKVKDEMISLVSHELKAPLTIIKGAVASLLDRITGELTEKQNTVVEIANRNLDRLVKLIDDLLNLSRLESGRALPKKGTVQLGLLLADMVGAYDEPAQLRSVSVNVKVPLGLPEVQADESMLIRVLDILLSQALQAARSRIVIKINPAQQAAVPHQDQAARFSDIPLVEGMEVSVEDDGEALPEGFEEKIFGKFGQAVRGGGKGEPKGSGLGLAIAKEILHLHRGRIWAENTDGGVRFHFFLPLK